MDICKSECLKPSLAYIRNESLPSRRGGKRVRIGSPSHLSELRLGCIAKGKYIANLTKTPHICYGCLVVRMQAAADAGFCGRRFWGGL